MTLNDKILEILNKSGTQIQEAFPGAGKNKEESAPMQGSSQKPEVKVLDKGSQGGETIRKSAAPLAAGKGAFEAKPMKQGDSKDAEKEELDANAPGKTASAKAKKMPVLTNRGAGKAPNFTDVADTASVVAQASSKGNVHQESTEVDETKEITEVEETEEEVIAERVTDADEAQEKAEKSEAKDRKKMVFKKKMRKEDIDRDIQSLFSTDVELSEEFKTKAASLFEAVVSARVADELESLEEQVAQEAVELIEAFKQDLVEQANEYLNYMAEEFIKENEVPLVNALRLEIAEEFMENIREAFVKSYIDIPDEKFDIVGEMQERIAALEAQLAEQTEAAEAVAEELVASMREAVLTQVTEGLAKTEAEKFRTLTTDVSFEDEESFAEKLNVIKENYFPKAIVSKKEEAPEVVGSQELSESSLVRAVAESLNKAVR